MERLMKDYLANKIDDLLDAKSVAQIREVECNADQIYPAKLKEGKHVCVQKFSKKMSKTAFSISLLHNKLQHPNIAKVLHFACNENDEYFVIYDLPYEGTVLEQIHCVDPRDIGLQLLSVLTFLQQKHVVVKDLQSETLLLRCHEHNKPTLQLCCLGRARPVPVQRVEDINCIPPELRGVCPYAESVYSAGSMIKLMLDQSKLVCSTEVGSWHRDDTSRKFSQPPNKIQALEMRIPRSPRLAEFETAFLNSIATRMTQSPKYRPSINDVVSMLQRDP